MAKEDTPPKKSQTTLSGFSLTEEDMNSLRNISNSSDRQIEIKQIFKSIIDEANKEEVLEKKMSAADPNTELLLKQILEKINSPSISDDRLSKDIGEIKNDLNEMKIYVVKVDNEISNLKQNASSREKTLNEVHQAIFHPFDGIYKTLNDNSSKFKSVDKKLDELEIKIENTKKILIIDIDQNEKILETKIKALDVNLDTKINVMDARIDKSEGKNILLENVSGGEGFPDIKNAVDSHKNFNKLWWALIAAVASGFGKFIWDMVKELN